MVSDAYYQASRPYITVLLWKNVLLIMNIEMCLGFSCKVDCFNFFKFKELTIVYVDSYDLVTTIFQNYMYIYHGPWFSLSVKKSRKVFVKESHHNIKFDVINKNNQLEFSCRVIE